MSFNRLNTPRSQPEKLWPGQVRGAGSIRRRVVMAFVMVATLAGMIGLPTTALAPVDAAGLSAPTGLTARNSGQDIELRWQPTNPDAVVGYEVYRNGARIGQPVTNRTVPLLAVGDIALCNSPAQIAGHTATANLVASLPGKLALVGDVVQGNGSWNSFINCYDNQWGRFKNRSFPIPGNHEWNTPGAAPFYQYFGNRAGTPGQGWISYNVGDWKVIGLDTNCWEIEGCVPGSAQYEWLRSELASSTSPCTVVYGHQPRWRSTLPNNAVYLKPLFDLMYEYGVELYLAGDQHVYARYGVNNADGFPDRNGIRQITIGTGGYSHGNFGFNAFPPIQARNRDTFGVLDLDLSPTSYNFNFVPAPGQGTFTDSGSAGCHGPNSSTVRFLDQGAAGQGHTYKVVAYDAQGNRSVARQVSVNGGGSSNPPPTSPPATSPPTPPTTSPTTAPPGVSNSEGAPVGSISSMRALSNGRIAVAGRASDPDSSSPARVTLTINGSQQRSGLARASRRSAGTNDGYYLSLAVGQGTHEACVSVDNVAGSGSRISLGCRQIVVGRSNPVGRVSAIGEVNGKIVARGWALDPDTKGPITVQVSVDGQFARAWPAGARWQKVERWFPGYSNRHGFWIQVPMTRGTHQVCVWAEDNSGVGGVSLGCRTVTR